MGDLISSIAWWAYCPFLVWSNWLTCARCVRVKRGVSARHPSKQPLNDADIDRIKEIAHVELEDARTELERANAAAHFMDQRNEDGDGGGDGDDIVDDDGDDSAWVECVLSAPAAGWLIDLLVARIVSPWTRTPPGRTPPQDETEIFPSTIWMGTTMKTMGRHRVRLVMPYLGSPPYILPSSWSLHQHKRVTILP